MSMFLEVASRCTETRIEDEAILRPVIADPKEKLRRQEEEARLKALRVGKVRAANIAERESRQEAEEEARRAAAQAVEERRLEKLAEVRRASEREAEEEERKVRDGAVAAGHSAVLEETRRLAAVPDTDFHSRLATEEAPLSYAQRLRIQKENQARLEKVMNLRGSILDAYGGELKVDTSAGHRSELELERLKRARNERMLDRMRDLEDLSREDAEEEEEERSAQLQKKQVRMEELEEVIAADRSAREIEEQEQAAAEEEALVRGLKLHPIDVLHKQIAEDLIRERLEEQAELEELDGASWVAKLDQYLALEREVWQEQAAIQRASTVQ